MNWEQVEASAKVIAERLSDLDGLGFYCKAVHLLGFQTCYELCSYSLDMQHQGKVKTTVGRYYNGCVMQEIKKRGLEWNTKHND